MVNIIGISTVCSIGQQLAADHPDAVRRLLLISTACRLGTVGRELTQHVANLLQSGADRRAMATADCPCTQGEDASQCCLALNAEPRHSDS
ncbi:MAG: alpha/beta hydrolase [Solirubrobacteraceae bacterium]|jgi:pimeloyl-ACP methyl ester carboxylesterase